MPKFNWKDSLQKYIKENPAKKSRKGMERETDNLFLNYMRKYTDSRCLQDQSYKIIPKFFDRRM